VDKAPWRSCLQARSTTGTFEARVTSLANDTLLARIIHAVEQAQGSRAPTQQFVDSFASIYTPDVFAWPCW
jgi:Cd2+/Zn2+-exporting ATPase